MSHSLVYLVFFAGLASAVHAETLKAGSIEPKTATTNTSSFNASYFSSDLSDEDILQQLWSEKTFEVRTALRHFDKRLVALLQNKKPLKKFVGKVVDLLVHSSPNIRDGAHAFLKKNAKILFEQKLLNEAKIAEYSKEAYHSQDELWKFVSLMNALLPDESEKSFMQVEYSFQILEGLMSENQHAAELARDIMMKNGDFLMKKNVWHLPHTKDFLLKFHDSPVDNKIHFLKVLEANLEGWVSIQYLNKHDFINTMILLRTTDVDLQQEFIRFITNAKNIQTLNKLSLFDRVWVDSLVTDITGENHDKKQVSLHLLSYLMKPFIDNNNLVHDDFKQVWSYVAAHLDAFDDPFEIVTSNFATLTKAGWFGRAHFDKLLASYGRVSVESKKLILTFLGSHYQKLATRGWIQTAPLTPILFARPEDKEILLMQLNFLNDHIELVNDQHIFGAAELTGLLKNLNHANTEVFGLAVDILDQGFDTMARDGALNKAALEELLTAEPSDLRTIKIFTVVANHFDHNLNLFDAASILKISDFAFSPLPKMTEITKDFFSKHYQILENKKWVKQELKNNLEKSGIWEELGFKTEIKKRRAHKRSLRS